MKRIFPVLLTLIILISGISTSAYSSEDDIAEKRYESGMKCFEKQDYEQAFSYFLIAGEVKGYAPAQNMLGICYRDGLGIEQNNAEAERYFKLASDQGYQEAIDHLAEIDNYSEDKAAGSNFYGEEIHLIRHTDGYYEILFDSLTKYDKMLQYDPESDNYYDQDSACWLWLNTYVTPKVWQYWYSGISSDFGNFGWMEWSEKDNAWYIETSSGNWDKLPEKYDAKALWHISP